VRYIALKKHLAILNLLGFYFNEKKSGIKIKRSFKALKDILEIEKKELKKLKVIKSYDIIGDVLIIKIYPELISKKRLIGEALHKLHPKIRTIAAIPLYSSTKEVYRTRDLEVIWGDENMETIHKESGCFFKVNPKEVFFSPRLSFERMRIAKKVLPNEIIINMFSGVGCFSIVIAKIQPKTKIYSIDVNPYAYKYMKENVALNKMEGKVIPILGDAREELKKLEGLADRVIIPLPEQAHSFLPLAVRGLNLNKGSGVGVIHYYDVASGKGDLFKTSIERAKNAISSAFGNSTEVAVEVEEKRIIRSVAPRKYHIVLDLCLKG
jgi:tRNA (guanine37-N1)-methyltransferase